MSNQKMQEDFFAAAIFLPGAHGWLEVTPCRHGITLPEIAPSPATEANFMTSNLLRRQAGLPPTGD